jgi:hypothetical protein
MEACDTVIYIDYIHQNKSTVFSSMTDKNSLKIPKG